MARNQYPGVCYRCGKTVPAGAGHFERKDGKWRVRHHDYRHPETHATHATMTCRMATEQSQSTRPVVRAPRAED